MNKYTNVTIECEEAGDLLVTEHPQYKSLSLHTRDADGGVLQINTTHIPHLVEALAALIAMESPLARKASLAYLKVTLENHLK